ncbi:MAG: N-acetylmuramoyl-L-alanine amidase [Eubacterium sp.]|nr:N-acetylmuramoyl-L-alanine amidase [Eubacterium sp.]
MKYNKTTKSILAGILAVIMTLSGFMPGYIGGVNAAANADAFTASVGDAAEDSTSTDATVVTDEDIPEYIFEEEEEEAEEILPSDLDVNFAVVEEALFETPSYNNYIVVDLGDGSDKFESATLTLLNETNRQEMVIDADTIMDSSLLFYADFPNASYKGKYLIEKINYVIDDQKYEKLITEDNMLPRFGVDKEISEEPNGWLDENTASSNTESDVTTIADNNASVMDLSDSFVAAEAVGVNGTNSDIVISDTAASAIVGSSYADAAGKEMASAISNRLGSSDTKGSSSGNVIIVLDPGHGAADSGAVKTWDGVTYRERDINQKIANACKAELQKTSGITVYMTRSSTTEPFHGNTSEDLAWRCKFAYEMGADLFVSLHCNSGLSTANGAEVWVPNSNYNTKVHDIGVEVGKAIVNKLASLGLANRGYKIRTSSSTKYPDKSMADYYAVIRGCKTYGIPGMIVEHGFLSNKEDCEKFFGSDEKIAALGVADAQGIVECIETIKNNRSGSVGETGWSTLNGKKIYRDANGNLKIGFFTIDGKTYYAGPDGYVVTGLKKINGARYYFDNEGVMLTNAWKKPKKVKYYFTSTGAAAANCWLTINNKLYYFKSNGKRYSSGWRTLSGRKYYFYSGGYVAVNKWMWNYGSKYRLGPDGKALIGLNKIGKNYYYFSSAGAMQYGWVKNNGNKYYMSWTNGKALKGWHTIWGRKYYFSKSTAKMKTGWLTVKKKTYYMLSDGGCMTGWNKIKKKIYYFNYSGVMQTGWTYYNYKKAYLKDDTGELAKNTFIILKNGKTYYFNKKYAMQTGLKTINKEKYYFADSGVMAVSKWVTVKNKKYYATADGKLAHDCWQKIDDKTYYFGSDYAYVTGTQTIDGKTYVFDENGVLTDGEAPEETSETDTTSELYAIMGTSSVTVDDMVKRYNSSGMTYPAKALKKGGAADITTFCTIIKEEAEAEGVKAEVLYAQVMIETGWLKFGGQVKISQYNFGGLGATDGGAGGATFKDVRTGLRAQTQHLKAYACKDALKNECVDPRFKYVSRGCAPYVEYLGMKENPSGKGWASAEGYGQHIIDLIKTIKK